MERMENGLNKRNNGAAAATAATASSKIEFREIKGCFLERKVAVFLCILAVCCIVAAGLVAAYMRSCPETTSITNDDHHSTGRNSTQTTGSDRSDEIPYLKLPTSVVPEHYVVELQPFVVPGNFTIKGKIRIRIRCDRPTANVTLHINELDVDLGSLRLVNVDGGRSQVSISRTGSDVDKHFFVVYVDGQLVAGRKYEISMEFLAKLQDNLSGFYRSFYLDKDGRKRWVASTQFQPTDARKVFPCFDEPAFKATFDITLVRKNNMKSLSNMPLLRSESRPENYEADVYETTVKMSTYLLAFAISDFVNLTSSAGTTLFRVWARKEAIDQAKYALEIGPKMLNYFEQYFNIRYPLPKLDMFAAPDFAAGAMENWGLIIYREVAMLIDPKQSSSSSRQRAAIIISHELAHQWFGNLVTPKWWDDLWLNEGFASYAEYLGVDAVYPEWKMHDQFVVSQVQDSMSLDGLRSSHPVSVPVYRPEDVHQIFDRISYGKGCSIIRMMQYFLGEQTFRKGITNYLNAKQFDNAEQNDLWMYLTQSAKSDGKNIDVRSVMDSWTIQTGFPVVNMKRDYDNQRVSLSQSRFLFDANMSNSSSIWKIPLTFTSSEVKNWDAEKIALWFNEKEGHLSKEDGIPSPDSWIVANIKETGFYKVNYDIKNWEMLINQLQVDKDAIPLTNRAQLIDDALDLARAGLLDYGLALNITLYLDKETEFVPWDAAMTNLHYIDQMLSLTPAYGKWKRYLLQKFLPLYEQVGWKEDPQESILEQYKRLGALGWACKYDHEPCVKTATELFRNWMQNVTDNPIPPNLRSVVYCTAMKHGGEETFNFAWSRYNVTNVASERNELMAGMTCTTEPWILHMLLEKALDPTSDIRKQDASLIYRSMTNHVVSSLLLFNFARDEWPAIYNRYKDAIFTLSGIVRSIVTRLNTRFSLDEVKQFYAEQKAKNRLGSTNRAFEQAIETVQVNVNWNERNFESIDSWLDNVLKKEETILKV